jgi:hypothetical protein
MNVTGTIMELGSGLGLSEERVQDLLSRLKSVASGEIPMTPEDFLKRISTDEQFSISDRVFVSFLVGSYIHGVESHGWQTIGIPERREIELMRILDEHLKGNLSLSTTEYLQFVVSKPGLCVLDRIYLAFACGADYDSPMI